MRNVLLAAALALAAVPSAHAADHLCAELSGRVNTEPLLGDCQYETGTEHNCQQVRVGTEKLVVCVPTLVRYASTAR